MEPVWILLTTYKRLDMARRTIVGLKTNLKYDNVGWMVTDDGSGNDYLAQIKQTIGPTYTIVAYDGQRRGVGHNMNWGLHHIFNELNGQLVLTMEDDWVLEKPLELLPYVNLLLHTVNAGMVRFGYAAPGLLADLISEENRLLWRIQRNGQTYRFTGHPSLRHKRFFDTYGYYIEGVPPGMTELDMCGKVNSKPGPEIYIPFEFNQWGAFGHIGTDSLADVEPEK